MRAGPVVGSPPTTELLETQSGGALMRRSLTATGYAFAGKDHTSPLFCFKEVNMLELYFPPFLAMPFNWHFIYLWS